MLNRFTTSATRSTTSANQGIFAHVEKSISKYVQLGLELDELTILVKDMKRFTQPGAPEHSTTSTANKTQDTDNFLTTNTKVQRKLVH
jgi:hypothetical protein